LAQKSPDYVVAIGSGSTKEIATTANTVHVGSIDYDEIIHAVNACDVVISGEDPAKEWAGDRKVLEAIAAGIPALTRPWSARLEQLGEDYPLYYTSAEELENLVVRLHTDPDFKASISQHIDTMLTRLSTDEAADRLAEEIRKVIPTNS
ncbi:MAG: hypothetical protein P8J87_05080, partial [Verrucomicrobiales bacterium]|nr:hypothetical protein [Verrucomicrobiales bacterium]